MPGSARGRSAWRARPARRSTGRSSRAIATGLGLGASMGRYIENRRPRPRHRDLSLLAAAYRRNIPVTVHVAVGTDIVHMHPACDPAALGRATHLDFRLFAAEVARLGGGGVYLNVGSAVLLPEVFLKAVTLARNLGHPLRDFATANLDFIQSYRPNTNVVERPTRGVGRGYQAHRASRADAAPARRRPRGKDPGVNSRIMPHRPRFKVGLVQMSMSADPDENLRKAAALVEAATAKGAEVVCLPELFRSPYFCQREDARPLRPGRAGARARARRRWARRRKEAGVASWWRRSSSAARRASTTTARPSSTPAARCVGLYRKMHIPDDPLVLREVLLHARRPGLPGLRHPGGPHRHPHLLGPVVPRGRAADRAAGRGRPLLSRPPSAGTRTRRREYGAAQRDAWQTIQRAPRHRQRRVRGGGEPRRPREAAARAARASSSGASSFLCRSVRRS